MHILCCLFLFLELSLLLAKRTDMQKPSAYSFHILKLHYYCIIYKRKKCQDLAIQSETADNALESSP